jgi:hypothetical protein
LNNSLDIAGESVSAAQYETAVLYSHGSTTPIDVNTLVDLPGVHLEKVQDINDAGQLLVRSDDGFYLLSPVPEPAAIASILLIAVIIRRSR